MMNHAVHFDFDIHDPTSPMLAQLDKLQVRYRGPNHKEDHLDPILNLASELKANATSRENMKQLGSGSGDLAVILLEPGDREASHKYEDIIRDQSRHSALRMVDSALRLAFGGERSIHNTVVLDSKPFRSKRAQECEDKETKVANNRLAHGAVKACLSRLQPKVILVCHCESIAGDADRSYSEASQINRACDVRHEQLDTGHLYIRVFGFHPGYVYRMNKSEEYEKHMRQSLFNLTFLVAANILIGQEISGPGISNVRDRVALGCFIPPPSLDWITSEHVIKELKELGIYSDNEHPEVRDGGPAYAILSRLTNSSSKGWLEVTDQKVPGNHS
ncbi:hypothetical protein FOMA001_g19916 [Fusarium oxysporum f. sp. matthiolae]|nr:hypothetical protein FOMA001_g19916 [Fusarium oxysporum f. sp. matthiolae]